MIIPEGTIRPTGLCHACRSPLTTTRFYCDKKCLSLVPPRLAAAMEILGETSARDCILKTLRATPSVIMAADMLGIDPTVLARVMRSHGIRREVVWS